MARRRLEAAIQAGQCIAKGKDYPEKFTRISIDHEIQLEKEVDGVYSLQYSFDGRFLALGCGNGTIRLYETATGQKLPDVRKSRYGGYPIMVLRFHPKNPSVIYAGTSEGQVLSCDISDFVNDGQVDYTSIDSDKDERWTEIIREQKHKDRRSTDKNEINCMDFDYTYTQYATAGKDLSIRIYDSTTNQLVREYTGYDNTKDPTNLKTAGAAGRVFALKFHPEFDDIFVTGGWDKQIKIWDSRSSDGVKRSIHGPHICGDAVDIKGYEILTGSYTSTDALQIWNYSTDYSHLNKDNKPKVVNFPCGSTGQMIYAAQFCDNDVVLAGGSGTHSAQAINSKTDEVLGEIKFDKAVQAIDTVFGGRMFAVGDGGRSLKMCSLK